MGHVGRDKSWRGENRRSRRKGEKEDLRVERGRRERKRGKARRKEEKV